MARLIIVIECLLHLSKYFAYQSCEKEQLKTVNTALYAQIQATGEPNTKNEKRLHRKKRNKN